MNASDSAVSEDTTQNSPQSNLAPENEAGIEYHPTESEVIENDEFSVDPNILAQEALFDSNVYFRIDTSDSYDDSTRSEYATYPGNHHFNEERHGRTPEIGNGVRDLNEERPPVWIPDIEAPKCMSCSSNFTVVKRRHHCRNCGKVFCARCSSNNVPLPKFGHNKPVRVCNKCFIYHLAPFTM